MFDRTLLPEAMFEFVVVADTHYMLDLGDRRVEFRSRRLQTTRADVALRMIAAIDEAVSRLCQPTFCSGLILLFRRT